MPDAPTIAVAPIPPALPVAPPAPAKPDALLIPKSWGEGLANEDYSAMVCAYAAGVLGPGRVFVRAPLPMSPNQSVFITKNPHDTELNENGHPHQFKPRYAWTDQPDGSRTGVLNADATPAKPYGREHCQTPANPLTKLMDEKRKAAGRA